MLTIVARAAGAHLHPRGLYHFHEAWLSLHCQHLCPFACQKQLDKHLSSLSSQMEGLPLGHVYYTISQRPSFRKEISESTNNEVRK